MQQLFVGKTHFFKLISISDKPRLEQLKIFTAICTFVLQASMNLYIRTRKGNTISEGKLGVKNIYEVSPTYQAH